MTDPTRQPFTVDDLTLAEHSILSRRLKGRPEWALANPESQNYAEALAGLAWLRDRRHTAGLKLEDYLERTLRDLSNDLGLGSPAGDEAHRTLAALAWVRAVTEAEYSEDVDALIEDGPVAWLERVDPDREPKGTVAGRALVYAVAGIDPAHQDQEAPQPAPKPAELAQDAIDDVTEENGQDPTVRPASPSSGT